MSGYIYIYGVNQEQFLASTSDKFAAIKEKYQGQTMHLTIGELKEIYYAETSKMGKVEAAKSGLTSFFFGEYQYLGEMAYYFLCGFDWKNGNLMNEFDFHTGGAYIFTRDQLQGITEWYMALSATANQEKGVDVQYQKPALYIINEYYHGKKGYDSYPAGPVFFYRNMKGVLGDLRDDVRNSSFDYFFFTSSPK